MLATCISCGRVFEASELYVKLVQSGKAESLCPYCSKEHDDDIGGYPDDE